MSVYEPLVKASADALRPLQTALGGASQLYALLVELGWDVPPDDAALERIKQLVPIADALDAIESPGTDIVELATLVQQVADAVRGLSSLTEADLTDLPMELATPELWADIAVALPDYLLARRIADAPALNAVMRLTGILWNEHHPVSGISRTRLAWDGLGGAIADPAAALAAWFGWPAAFDDQRLLGQLGLSLSRLGLRARHQQATQQVLDAIASDGRGAPRATLQTVVPLYAEGATTVGVVVTSAATDQQPVGLYVGNVAYGELGTSLDLGGGWTLTATGELDGTATVGAILRPDGVHRVSTSPTAGAELRLEGGPDSPWILIGTDDGTRIQLSGATFAIGLSVDGDETELWASAGTAGDGLSVVIDLGGADSFLRGLLGDAGLTCDLTAGVRWSSLTGFAFSGGVGLELEIPIDRQVGPVTLTRARLALAPGDSGGGSIEAALTGGLLYGPFQVTVDEIGAALALLADTASMAGVSAELTFLPPHRVVLAIESDVVNGGGFVEIESETGRYSGGLALDAFGVGIGAIVVVDTKIAGDPNGWALFASLGATFPTPLPLGFGFTLIGVGGLLALNRTIDVDSLAEALRDGAADSVLFPDDIEQDAEQVLAGLDLWFPTQDGTTVVGPVAEIGWGSPTLISAQLGVIVALPDLIITLLGSVEVLLPTQDAAVLSLRMDVIGAVDVPASTVTVEASLHDSNLLGVFQLSGDMGFYACLAEQPQFVLSIGGYSPQWHPPGSLPAWLLDLRRISASIPLGLGVDVTLTVYVAVTSNSVQFGGRVKIVAAVEVLLTTYSAEGWFGVNVLLLLEPFTIKARATAGVSISAGDKELLGVDLRTRIDGPQPWYATGRAEFTFFGIDVPFEFAIGAEPGGEPREKHDVATDVSRAVAPPDGWQAVDSGDSWGSGLVVDDEWPAGLWARPDQLVEVRQSVAPLNRTMTAFGEYIPDPDRIDATDVTLGGQAVSSPAWVDDWFAPAQFDRLDDTTRLSAPSYELMTAGVRFGDAGVAISTDAADCTSVSRAPEESIWPDGAPKTSPYTGPARNVSAVPAVRSVTGPKLELLPTSYTVAESDSGRIAEAALAEAGLSGACLYAQATAVIEARAGSDPGERRRLRVVPSQAVVEA